jgi:hypothetical protein
VPQAALLAIKYPSVLNLRSEAVAGRVDRLAHVAAAREQWLDDLEGMTPSLLAYFLKDAPDLLLRLEYLASTGGEAWVWEGGRGGQGEGRG